MIGFVGIAIVFAMVFGGYIIAGGKIGIILHAAPYELMMIMGAALGAFVIGNDTHGIKHTLKDVGKVFKGPYWKPQDFRDLLCLMFQLLHIAKTNPVMLDTPCRGSSSLTNLLGLSKDPGGQGRRGANHGYASLRIHEL